MRIGESPELDHVAELQPARRAAARRCSTAFDSDRRAIRPLEIEDRRAVLLLDPDALRIVL